MNFDIQNLKPGDTFVVDFETALRIQNELEENNKNKNHVLSFDVIPLFPIAVRRMSAKNGSYYVRFIIR